MSFFYERTKSVGAGSSGKQLDEGEDETTLQTLRKRTDKICSMTKHELVIVSSALTSISLGF